MSLQQRSIRISFLLIISLFISCDQDNSNSQPILGLPTTFEIITNSEDHLILTNLLQENGLDEILNEGIFTVFAPVDAAFENLDPSSLTESELINLLLYHVIQGNATSGNLSDNYIDTQATVTINERTSNLSVLVRLEESIRLNGNAIVLDADIAASNGTIHTIDQLIEIPKLSDFINNDPDFSILLEALSREDQPDYLETLTTNLESEPAPITLFAPSDDAFVKALDLLILDNISEINPATLSEILNLHLILNTNLREIDFTEETIETLGGNLNYDSENNVIVDANGREIIFVTRDVQATNGVLHVLEDVIFPETDFPEPVVVNEVNFSLDNEGTAAYFVTAINGNEVISALDENNSTWTFTIGTRYNINVINADNHPLEIRNTDNEVLLSQATEGSFETDPDVAFSNTETVMSFTLTQNLANQISSYFCSNHPEMNGSILVN